MGLRKQPCLDLVVRKVTYGRKTLAFDANMLSAFTGEMVEVSDTPIEDESEGGSDTECVSLGEAVQRLRTICRDFKKKPALMDEIRNITQKDEYNGKRLKVIWIVKLVGIASF